MDKIVLTVDPKINDHILEIGPGEGVLSEKILPQVKEMLAIEIDPLLVDYLNNQKNLKELTIIQGDVLVNNIKTLPITNPVRVIGNIPYNITSPIIFWLIEQLEYWDDAYIMVQKELAQRLTAKVNTKAYGRLTVVVGAYLNVNCRFMIPPDVFIPKPKVDSAFIYLTKKKQPLIKDEDYVKFNKIVTAAFNQRRKMLRNSIKSWEFSEVVKEKIDFSRRPESLSIKEFAFLV